MKLFPWAIMALITLLTNAENTKSYDESALDAVAKRASGVYMDAGKAKEMHTERTVIVTCGNWGFMNMVHNLKCWVDRLEMKVLVMSLDNRAHSYVDKGLNDRSKNEPQSFHSFLWRAGEGAVSEATSDFHQGQFHTITVAKLEGVLALLRLNYKVLFIDADLALIRDPFPYLQWQNLDYVHSVNAICPQSAKWDFWKSPPEMEGNTGFYWVNATANSIRLFETVIKAAPGHPQDDDQNLMWKVLRSKQLAVNEALRVVPMTHCRDFDYTGTVRTVAKAPSRAVKVVPMHPNIKAEDVPAIVDHTLFHRPTGEMSEYDDMVAMGGLAAKSDHSNELVTCPLDGCVFSAGAIRGVAYHMLENNLRARNESSAMIHANYLKGNKKKMDMLYHYGLWLYTGEEAATTAKPQKGREGSSNPICKSFESTLTCKEHPRLCQKLSGFAGKPPPAMATVHTTRRPAQHK